MTDVVFVVRVALAATFTGLALLGLGRAERLGPAGWWVTAAFGSVGASLMTARVAELAGLGLPVWLDAARLVLIVAFPYLLLRFTASFRPLPRSLEIVAAGGFVAAAVVVATPLLDQPPALFVVLAYWTLVSSVTVVRMWRAGRDQPGVARARMRLMGTATAVVTAALLGRSLVDGRSATIDLAVNAIALAIGATFWLGFNPPRVLRLAWGRTEAEDLQRATVAVLGAETVDEVGRALLPPTVRMVAGAGAVLADRDGHVMASYGTAPPVGAGLDGPAGAADDEAPREDIALQDGHGWLVVWTSPYTPFFGHDQVELLRAMGAVARLAVERTRQLELDRVQRAELEQAQGAAERAREEAEQASQAKSEFMSRMSHELRTPLNAVLGFGQLLETSELTGPDQDAVGHILKGGHHLLKLVDDLLDLSRIEAGTLTISPEPVHLGELIADAVALVQPRADSRSIRLTTDPGSCEVYVHTDRQRARQVLLNLLSNAVKYNHDGGEVHVRCHTTTDASARVSVRDTGPGIAPDRQHLLFEPFERLGAENTGVEGTGLGLALSRQLVEHLDGAIGVDAASGRGSTFWIELPVTDAPADTGAPSTRSPDQPAGSGHQTLLVIEDNLANLHLIEAVLTRSRHDISVLPAMQGSLGIELAAEHRPDAILLDLHLPDIPGREVLHRLRADPRTRAIPVIIASADASPRRIEQLRDEGALDYITKPLDIAHLLAVLDTALASPARPA